MQNVAPFYTEFIHSRYIQAINIESTIIIIKLSHFNMFMHYFY